MDRRCCRRKAVKALAAVVWAGPGAQAGKPQPAVGARWEGVPATTRTDHRVTVTLRVTASEDAPRVTIRLLPTAGVALSGPASPRAAAMRRGQILDLPVTFRVTREGTWTLGAAVTNSQPGDTQVAGAVITIVARGGAATLST